MKMVEQHSNEVPMESSLQAGKWATILHNVTQKRCDVMQSMCTSEGITEKDNIQQQNYVVDILLVLEFSYCQ